MPPVRIPRPPPVQPAAPGHGGVRAGAGRPRGSTVASGGSRVYRRTAERAELLSLWRAEVSHQFKSLVQAQLSAAQGVTHMVARDDQGKWTTVTDPDVMVERLNAGAEAYRLSAVAPNATLIGQIMDRLFGQARQTIDLDVSTEPSRLSDIELSASLSGLLQKLAPADPPAELAAPSRDVSGLTTGAEVPTGSEIPTEEQAPPATDPDV
mgnify:FL=1|jgi:hypothetical protein